MIYYLYPLLLCTIPVHAIFLQNLREIETKYYIKTLLIITIAAITGCFGINIFVKNLFLSELIFCVIFFLLLYGNNFYMRGISNCWWEKENTQIPFLSGYIIFNILLAFGIYYFLRNINLVLFSKIIFYLSLFIIVTMLFNNLNNSKKNIEIKLEEKELPENHPDNLPDIYHIVLDAHIGFERQEYRDEYFYNELKSRGFYIFENFKSNYNVTNLSMPSILNMDYLHNLLNKKQSGYYPVQDCCLYYIDNKLWALLKKYNYNINLTAFPGFNKILQKTRIDINKYLIDGTNIHLRALLFPSIFEFILNPVKKAYCIHKRVFEKYKNLCISTSDSNQNIYNFTHIMAPHAPFLYDENGKKLEKEEVFEHKNYFSYLKYTDKKVLDIIDTIQKTMKKNSVIVIHGDHGLHFSDYAYNALCCVYFPDKNYTDMPQQLTAVNLFAYILNKFFNTSYKYKTNQFYRACMFDSSYVYETDTNKHIDKYKDLEVVKYNKENYQRQLNNLSKKYKNKKVVLYGAGIFFKNMKQNYDLSQLNIIAVSDKKFEGIENLVFDAETGYNVIAPEKIYTLKPDIVIIMTQETIQIKKYFKNELFKKTGKSFKYITFRDTYKDYKNYEWFHACFLDATV